MASEQDLAQQRIYMPNVMHNQSLNNVRFISACFAGAVAGILGLENTKGFLLFIVSTLLSAASIYFINCKTRPNKFLSGGWWELVNPGQDNLWSFVLVWTLAYGMFTIPLQRLLGLLNRCL
jgi:ER membrane protein complex subunit 6